MKNERDCHIPDFFRCGLSNTVKEKHRLVKTNVSLVILNVACGLEGKIANMDFIFFFTSAICYTCFAHLMKVHEDSNLTESGSQEEPLEGPIETSDTRPVSGKGVKICPLQESTLSFPSHFSLVTN